MGSIVQERRTRRFQIVSRFRPSRSIKISKSRLKKLSRNKKDKDGFARSEFKYEDEITKKGPQSTVQYRHRAAGIQGSLHWLTGNARLSLYTSVHTALPLTVLICSVNSRASPLRAEPQYLYPPSTARRLLDTTHMQFDRSNQ